MKSKWRSFEDAIKFARKLKLKGAKEWRVYSKSKDKPTDIPNNPSSVYKNKGWVSWGDFLDTSNVSDKLKRELWWTFEKSRKFVHNLNLKNRYDWNEYCQSSRKSKHIPSNPNQVYKKEWKGIGDWLGTGVPFGRQKYFRSFDDARKFVHGLRIKNQKEWFEYCKSGEKPDDIPNVPRSAYKKEWKGVGDWLDNGSSRRYKFRSFEDARKFVHGLKFRNAIEWGTYCKSGKKPEDIPQSIQQIYKNKGWNGWGDFLGTGNVSSRNYKFRSFEDARKFVHGLQIKSQQGWYKYCKSEEKPDNIPQDPSTQYKNKGWKGLGDWLGTGRQATRTATYLTFENCKFFAQSLKLSGQSEWVKYCKSGEKPNNVPSAPWKVYKNKGWTDMRNFFGTEFLPFNQAREEIKKLAKKYHLKNKNDWDNFVKSGNKPDDIPSTPWKVYKKKKSILRD